MSTREVVVLGGARTAIGDYGGALKDFAPTKLGAIAIREALARAGVDPATVGHVVMGSVIHGEARELSPYMRCDWSCSAFCRLWNASRFFSRYEPMKPCMALP